MSGHAQCHFEQMLSPKRKPIVQAQECHMARGSRPSEVHMPERPRGSSVREQRERGSSLGK